MRKMKLTKEKYTLVDDEDYEYLNQWKWTYMCTYARRNATIAPKKRKTIHMHRLIMGIGDELQIDHIDGNRLNNQKSNLRICTQEDNAKNLTLYKSNTSGYKGVTWHKLVQKWQARITINKERITLGYFDDIENAAQAYNYAAQAGHGEFAKLNIIKGDTNV